MRSVSLETQTLYSLSKEELPKIKATLALGEPFLEQSAPNERYEENKVLLAYGLQVKSVQEALSFRGKKSKIYPLHISVPMQREQQIISRTRALALAQGENTFAPDFLEDLPAFLNDQLYERSIDEKTKKEIVTPVFTEDTLRILFDSLTPSLLPKVRQVRFAFRKSPYNDSVSRLETQVNLEKAATVQIKDRREKTQLGEIKNNEERLGIVADHFIDYAQTDTPSNRNKKNKKKKLRKLYSTFGLSEFSFETLVGTHGQLVISDFLDNLQLAFNLNPTSNDRKALLSLAAVTSEAEFPAVHQLVSAISEYDSRSKRKNVRSQKSSPVEKFFAPNKRRLDPVKREQIKQGRKQFTDQFADSLRKKRQVNSTDPKLMLEGLLAFHNVEMPKNLKNFISRIAQKPLIELQHDEIAIILSAQMEIITRTQAETTIDQTGQLIADLTKQLNDHGHYFFNMDFSEHHDKDTYHGVLIALPDGTVQFDLCLIHTPAIDLQLANLSFELSIPSAPSFSISTLSGLTETLGESIPLFAQALAFDGVSSVISGGEETNNTKAGGSIAQPKSSKTLRKVFKPKVIYQASMSGSGGEKKLANPIKNKSEPKSKIQKRVAIALPKKIEKPKAAPQSSVSRSKPREIPVYIARPKPQRRVSKLVKKEKKVAPPLAEKLTVKHVPKPIVKPRIVSRSRIDQKIPVSRSVQQSQTKHDVTPSLNQVRSRVVTGKEVPTLSTRRIEQSFPTRANRRVTTRPVTHAVTIVRLETSKIARRQTIRRSYQRKTDVAQTQHRAHSQLEHASKTVTIPAHQENRVKPTTSTKIIKKELKTPVRLAHTPIEKKVGKKEVIKQSPLVVKAAVTSSNQVKESTANKTGLLSGVLFEASIQSSIIQNQFSDKSVLVIKKSKDVIQKKEANSISSILSSKNSDFGQSRRGRDGAKNAKQKKKKLSFKTSDTDSIKTEQVLTATMRSLPINTIFDVSDSFNTAREVKMWAQEAMAHPKLMEKYYSTKI